jgi:HEAT repeat protein
MVKALLFVLALQGAQDRLAPILERWRSAKDEDRLQALRDAAALPKDAAGELLDQISRGKIPSGAGLAVPLLRHGDFTTAWRSTETLLQLDARDRVSEMAPLLKAADGSLRPNVLHAMLRLGGREHGPLVAPFLGDADPSVAMAAVELLGRFGSREYADRLVRFLDAGEPTHRQTAIAALAAMGAKEMSERIGRHLNDPNVLVRWEAVRALGRLRAREFAGQIVAMSDENGAQAPIIEALGRFGLRELAPHLLPFLDVPEAGIRWRAVRALGDVDAKDDAERIAEMLQDLDNYVRLCALRALAAMGSREQCAKMLELLRDEEPEVSKGAAEEASALATAEQLKAVVPMVGDEDGFVRWSAARLLVAAEYRGALQSMVERLKAGTGTPRDLAWAIGRLGGADERGAVAAVLRSDDVHVRVQAALALARLGGGLNELAAVEKTTEGAVKLAASIGLVRLGRKDRAAAAPLLADAVLHREEPDYQGLTDELIDALSAGFEKELYGALARPVTTAKRIESAKDLEALLAKAGVTVDELPELVRRVPAGSSMSARRALEWSFGPAARLVPLKGRIHILASEAALDHWRKRLGAP